jgi:hypothetical protein
MDKKRRGEKELTLLEGLSRITPKDLEITLNKSESAALKKAFTEEEEARNNDFVLRGSIRR